jgi:hypothetical protein
MNATLSLHGLPEERGGAQGDAVTIGQIVLAALSSGTVVALFQVI